ncbi:STAS/SEC14 domain-containing protein [Litorilituus lipolyticus]|uniref:STAS/SEC14 domain-containing protein n=1 Tax=Litorilituus lipolyticus TaxID=2491017 RepID=A0A502KX32_9GAMM|nr:STAS/SEC14 domain-containing protein [Litorilituus lipolyticus]TPH15664.1 STAS/SEC14 domain-containing protein [Litorilituus lipolyticus]
MEVHQVSFATIKVLKPNLGEVIVNEGVEVNTVMVTEMHQKFVEIFASSFSLLINKKHAYSTQLDALIKFGELSAIDKIAIYAPNQLAKLSADFSATIPSSAKLNIEVFTQRDDALSWLL